MPSASIIIPTCNRAEFLLASISAILTYVNDVEIIVSDNSETDEIRLLLAPQIQNGTVRYEYIPNPVSVVENFERAISLATGDFITCIGDDDCVGPGFNDVLAWVKANEIDAVYSYNNRFIANYFWPKVTSHYFGQGYQAKLFVTNYTGRAIKIDGKNAVRTAAKNLGNGLGLMPRIYHGLVRKTLLDNIRHKYGSIFGGVSPDIYSATLISLEASRIYQIDAPFILPGASPKSTAGEGAARTDRSNLFEVEHIRRFGSNLVWSEKIPAFYSPHNVWAYSMLCALNKAHPQDVHPNFMRLILKGLIGDWSFRKQILSTASFNIKNTGLFINALNLFNASLSEMYFIIRRIYWKFISKPTTYENINDIGAALTILLKEEKHRSFHLRDILDKSL